MKSYQGAVLHTFLELLTAFINHAGSIEKFSNSNLYVII